MKLDRWTRRALFALAAVTTLLTGCTSYVTTQVTAFSDWSGSDATRSYAFQRTPEQQNNLEQSAYEQVVGNELAAHGFRRISAQEAHYLVGIGYGMRSDMVTVSQPVYYNPWPGPYYWGRPMDPWGPWGPWGPFPAAYASQTYPVFTHSLGIRIIDRASGKEVYNVTARNASDDSSLIGAMPYLAHSALADFPLANGVVRTVKIPIDKNGAVSNEVAVGGAAPPLPASAAKVVQ
jgi:Domain of unknown function (DUF4136)